MKILLTGSHGFVGSHFRDRCQDDVLSWDIKIGKDILDITEKDLQGIDVVVHLAAKISVEQSWSDKLGYLRNNVEGTLRLMQEAEKARVRRVVYASSSSVYGNPLSPYGASKLSGEHFINCFSHVMETVVLRFYNIFGKGQNREYAGVITNFFNCIYENTDLTVYGDGEQTRDFTYVDDVVEILLNACRTQDKRIVGNAVDIGRSRPVSINKLAEIMLSFSGKDLKVKHEHERVEIRHSKCPYPTYGKILLGREWTTLEDGIMAMLL